MSKEQVHSNDKAATKPSLAQPGIASLETLLDQPCPVPAFPRAGFDPRALSPVEMLRLQRTIGNRAVDQLLLKSGRPNTPCGAGRPAAPPIQRKPENEKPLGDIQGHAMFNLLPLLEALPAEVRTDTEAGSFVGGPRLLTAMNVVKAKGTAWLEFAAAHNGELAALPADQIADIMRYLGAPKDARYFQASEFGGKFDGAVDPSKGEVVLFFRVKFELEGARFGPSSAGTPEWEAETKAGLDKFKADFKQGVESTWKGTIKPSAPIGSLATFQFRTVVTTVESGEHTVFHLVSDAVGGRSHAKPGEGTLQVGANEKTLKDKDHPVMDDKGRPAGTVSNEQIPSAHEFGHAVGLHHPQCAAGDDKCYGKTAQERGSIMGAGHTMTVVERGGQIRHNDFGPFLEIAQRWGQDVFPGALATHNKWTAGG